MANPSKQKGTAAESLVVTYLHAFGFHGAERRALAGNLDRGDIAGIPDFCGEVKACKTFDLAGWVDELEVERHNANARFGTVIAKRRGTPDVGRWYSIQPLAVYLDTLKAAQA